MKRLRLGLVGCGDIATYTSLFSRLIPRLQITACCDLDSDRAAGFSHRHCIPWDTTEYERLLEHEAVDAVYLAVPHDLHHSMIMAAVDADKPVLVEKPITRTLEEARDLLEHIGAHKVGVNYQYRYDRGCFQLYHAVRSGSLGRVHSVRINVPWRRTQAYFDGSPWHASIERAGGGTLITQGSHFLDAVLWALGEAPAGASGYIASQGFNVEVETLAHGIVETDAGTLISITSSMEAHRESAVEIEVYGERGTALYRDKPFPSVRFKGVHVKRGTLPVPGVHALQRSLVGFTRWVLDGGSYLIPAPEAVPVLAAVDAVYRSARLGRQVRVE